MRAVKTVHSIAVLNRMLIIAGGINEAYRPFSSMEFICTRILLKFAPVIYPLPTVKNQILQIGICDGSKTIHVAGATTTYNNNNNN